jgi:ubiquinone/menaquinone biosynthesis C-methylase UbiE
VDSRIDREKGFFDASPEGERQRVVKFYAITESSTAWYENLLKEFAPDRRVLELGCGEGEAALRLARWGARVDAIDVSEGRIGTAQQKAASEGLTDVSFQVMNAEELLFDDSTFDFICGQAVIHHLDLERTFAEVVRTLKPNGRAVFVEPMGHNPLINLYRGRTPNLRTPDEHPLVMLDLALAGRFFAQVESKFFHLTTFAALPFARSSRFPRIAARLDAFDERLMRVFPFLGRYGWRVVISLANPRKPVAAPS